MTTKTNTPVIQDNSLINACYTLSTVEKRIFLLAIAQSNEGNEITSDSLVSISVDDYVNYFEVERRSAYKTLKKATKTLFNRYIPTEYLTPKGNVAKEEIRWINKAVYVENESTIKFRFNPEIIPFIGYMKGRVNYTRYFIEDVAGMTSIYAIRLYELIISWRTTHKVPFITLEELKNKLGVEEDKYKAIKDFKKYVLEVAVNQINEHSNIKVDVEQHKTGRRVSGFTFTFVELKNPERDTKTIDWVNEPPKPTKKAQNLPELIFDDVVAQKIYEQISRVLNAEGHNTVEARQMFAKVEIDEAYEAIKNTQKLVDTDKNPINEIQFKEKLRELFGMKNK